MTQFNETYEEMVKNLFKPLPTVGEMAHHASTGISGEVGELAVATDRKNMLEEMGDLEFYMEALALQAGPAVLVDEDEAPSPFTFITPSLAVVAAELLDLTKKSWIYGKPLPVRDIQHGLGTFRFLLDRLYHFVGTSKAEVRHLNQTKLMKRYPSGYTNEAAIARADKA